MSAVVVTMPTHRKPGVTVTRERGVGGRNGVAELHVAAGGVVDVRRAASGRGVLFGVTDGAGGTSAGVWLTLDEARALAGLLQEHYGQGGA